MSSRWFPHLVFRLRGWGLLGTGALSLLLAQVMGRRDLLALSVFLMALPLLAGWGSRMLRPRFSVHRGFSPASVETGTTATVHLALSGNSFGGGRVSMSEQLPARFGTPPSFTYPARNSGAGGVSRYEYRLQPLARGQFGIGPVTADFTDPFGLSGHRQNLGMTDLLTVTPAAVELPGTTLAGTRAEEGRTATRKRAHPSDDDVMTREYRHGDPMRRVHWPATARHGELMVRQEESVSTPEATLLLDSRWGHFAPLGHASGGASRTGSVAHTASASPAGSGMAELQSSDAFEWTVVAAISVAAHLIERGFSLRILDPSGESGFHTSKSAADPWEESFEGDAGLSAVALALAALELTAKPVQHSGVSVHSEDKAVTETLLDQLATRRHHGPLVALVGQLSLDCAAALAPAAEYGAGAFAIICSDRPQEAGPVLTILRGGGWRAIAVDPRAELPAVWGCFDDAEFFVAAGGSVSRSGALSGGDSLRGRP
ncbi:DUF58 domain-containing protein [Arthrobacter sp. H14-L1]|uniref:DUF58 domain-containing protein n=1 Tax=Arthrobacter sp. H14-L1 TaxID=2996697 RepID=UPI00226ED87F|nr:DUF58 domain-containing protein [Arthrobacter sp. H14-L1]MCY0904953.1 DUF58 domain-containing protein [Arthrobacter sp. H14-L1]